MLEEKIEKKKKMMVGIKKKNLLIVSGKINYLMWIVFMMGINKIFDWFFLSC